MLNELNFYEKQNCFHKREQVPGIPSLLMCLFRKIWVLLFITCVTKTLQYAPKIIS